MNSNKKKAKHPVKDKIIKNYGSIKSRIEGAAASAATKSIKKESGKMKKNDISEVEVRRKLKEKRVVLPSRRMAMSDKFK